MNRDDVVRLIEGAIEGRGRIRAGIETQFVCPAHDDHTPSARWNPKKQAWYCDVCGNGGGYLDLAARLGIEVPTPQGLTVAELAAAKGLPESFLRELGVRDGFAGVPRTPCVDIPYVDARGEVLSIRKRLRLKGEPRFMWRRGDHVAPYGVSVLEQARTQTNYLIFVEGESDQWVSRYAGVPAIGIPGASTMKPEWGALAEGIARIFVWKEPGAGGETFVRKVFAAVPNVQVIAAPAGAKDPSDLWLECGLDVKEFQARLSELAANAPFASALQAKVIDDEATRSFEMAADLLHEPKLIDRVADAIRDCGYAGDLTPPLLAYVGITSRLLARPLNLAYVAPSGAGKNQSVDSALPLFPPSAYFIEKAGSARSLIYSNEDFQHRAVIVAEADSIPEDGSGASAVRSLASDNEMTYDVVEKGPSGEFATRRIVKQGPTGLITTSTRPLPHQFDTRTLAVGVADSAEQTRGVMRAHAARVNGLLQPPPLGAFVALQTWLQAAGERRVFIPYANALADLVPSHHVRMRRDFRQLLTVIETIAVLYQRQRERDADGRILATLDDYILARRLLREVFQTVATGGVTQPVRETVQAVERLYDGEPLTKQQVANDLQIAKDTAWYRLKRAIALGYVINDEARRGSPAKLRPGDPLPEERPALPAVAEVWACVQNLRDVDSTIQPDTASESAQADEPVETWVESGVQPGIQPWQGGDSDSFDSSISNQVEGLNADREAAHNPRDFEMEEVRI